MFPVIRCCDIRQTTWPQLGCFAAKPVQRWCATVTEWQQRLFVPTQTEFFGRKPVVSRSFLFNHGKARF
jgi:hypothetical protein